MGEPVRQPDAETLQSYFAIVVSRFNSKVTDKLREGALECLNAHGIPADQIQVHEVPGAFELPLAAQALAKSGKFAAVVALGCVIRGETSHYDYVCEAAMQGLLKVSLDHELPVAFGLLTTENGQQALARAGGDKGNKGAEAVEVVLEMCGLLRDIQSSD